MFYAYSKIQVILDVFVVRYLHNLYLNSKLQFQRGNCEKTKTNCFIGF